MSTATKTEPPCGNRGPGVNPTSTHAVLHLSELTHATEPTTEFQIGKPRRSVPLLSSSGEGRLDVIQRDLQCATVYYLNDEQYAAVYSSHHKGRAPGPDNLSFTLIDQGIIVVRVHNNDGGPPNLSLRKGTATITDSHMAVLDEAVKQGLSVLRGLSEGATQYALEERRERLSERRLVAGYEERLPTAKTEPLQTLSVSVLVPGIALRSTVHTLSATLVSAGEEKYYVAKSADFNTVSTARSTSPVIELPTPDGAKVLIVDESRLVESLVDLRASLLAEPTSGKLLLLKQLERFAVASFSETEREKLGDTAFEMLTATLERHRAENLSPERLTEALHDVIQAAPLRHEDALVALRSAVECFALVDATLTNGTDSALRSLDEVFSHDPSADIPRGQKEQREYLRQRASSRALLSDPSERLHEARRNRVDVAKPNEKPAEVVRDQVARVGFFPNDVSVLEQELRHNAPRGIQIPASCTCQTDLRRDVLDDKGQYLQTKFSDFEMELHLRGGGTIKGSAEVRWHTRTQDSKPELPSYRVTLYAGAATYELTSLAFISDPRSVPEGQYFVSNANGARHLFKMNNGEPQSLGALNQFGLIETSEGQFYSRSCKRVTDDESHLVPADNFGRELSVDKQYILKELWHLPYIPSVMDIS